MIILLAFWGLGSFIFFKVGFDVVFGRDVSIIAAILLAVLVPISVYYSSYFYAMKNAKNLARSNMLKEQNSFFFSSLPIFLVTSAINIFISKLIIFGFSKNINNYEMGGKLFFSKYSGDAAFHFIGLILAPIALHYAMVLFGVYTSNKLNKN